MTSEDKPQIFINIYTKFYISHNKRDVCDYKHLTQDILNILKENLKVRYQIFFSIF